MIYVAFIGAWRDPVRNCCLFDFGLIACALDGDKLDPAKSRYTKYILDLLKSKGQGQVVNRQEIITTLEPSVEFMAPNKFRLEPIWTCVTLAALGN